jgi:hypothetical protein
MLPQLGGEVDGAHAEERTATEVRRQVDQLAGGVLEDDATHGRFRGRSR